VNAFEFDELDLGLSVSAWRCVLQVLGECTAFDPVAVLIKSADYALLHICEFVQLEPDKLIYVRTEVDSLAWHYHEILCRGNRMLLT
jgi:hypothetical protein